MKKAGNSFMKAVKRGFAYWIDLMAFSIFIYGIILGVLLVSAIISTL